MNVYVLGCEAQECCQTSLIEPPRRGRREEGEKPPPTPNTAEMMGTGWPG